MCSPLTNGSSFSTLRKSAQQAADHALSILSRLSVRVSISDGLFLCKIHKMDFSLYRLGFFKTNKYFKLLPHHELYIIRLQVSITLCDRIQLCAPPTSSSVDHHQNEFHREGYILSVSLEDGSVGYGEVGFGFNFSVLVQLLFFPLFFSSWAPCENLYMWRS